MLSGIAQRFKRATRSNTVPFRTGRIWLAARSRGMFLRSSQLWLFAGLSAGAFLSIIVASSDTDRVHGQQQTPAQICAALITDTTQTSLRSDCEVLLGIRDTLRGTVTLNWGADTAFASWTGVFAQGTGANRRVTYLWPRHMGLDGTIPAGVSGLTGLNRLWLEGNRLTGSIPSELGSISSLTHLNLRSNRLTGEIPEELGELSNLQEMSLWANQLTGEIPDLSGLTNLRLLYLNQNQLTGSIPSTLGSLSNLQYLYLWVNRLSGPIPAELGNLSNLQRLYLYQNQLTGSIPSELGSLSNLQHLYLWGNRLSGPIPAELGNLSSLQRLHLNLNQLTGPIPSELGSISSLTQLSLHTNHLTGEIPDLSGLTSLTYLYLNLNQLTGPIPSELGSISSLTQLSLHTNHLTGEIPDLSGLTSLTHLYLTRNQLTGGIPSWLNSLTNLEDLFLWGNRLTGEIPDLSGLTNLTRLTMSQNQLTGGVPSWLGGLTGLTVLNLNQNDLTGEIPASLNNLTSLTELDLADNQLSGDVPNLNALTELERLGLGGNDLNLSWDTFASTGNVNLETKASSIVRLFLHDSGIEGQIPNWIGARHTDLTHLWLQDNGLTGAIPANFSDLVNLVDLRLEGNYFSGGWEQLSGLPALEELTLAASAFTGSGRSFSVAVRPVFLRLSLPSAADPSRSGVTLGPASIDADDVHVPPHPQIARTVRVFTDSAVDIATDLRDAQGEPVSETGGLPAVVCLPVPSADAGEDVRVLKSDDGQVWEYLEAADPPSGYDPGAGNVAACGTTDSFSLFVPAVVEIASGGSTGAGALERISRIEPAIRSVTVSSGDRVQLSFDIYGRQKILDNNLAEGHVFTWDDGDAGGGFETTDESNTIIYTAPERPGTHTVTATSPTGACLSGDDAEENDDRCTAKFTITVRRTSAVPEERPAPENPVGEIPPVLVDAEGRQYEVLTPEEGGRFEGEGYSIIGPPGAVPNLEIVGVRMDPAGVASNAGITAHRYTLVGEVYDLLALDAEGALLSSYVLDAPLEVCLPLPPEARSNISDVAVVMNNLDGTLTVLSASVRIVPSGVNVCGNLSNLPASIAVGTAGAPDALPTATPQADAAAPDTGGNALSVYLLLVATLMSFAVVLVGLRLITRVNRR